MKIAFSNILGTLAAVAAFAIGTAADAQNRTATPSDFGPPPSTWGTSDRDGREPLRFDFREDRQPAAPARPAAKPGELTGVDLVDAKLTSRYGKTDVANFVKSTSGSTFVNLYLEAFRLIDSRHINPASYEDRVEQAVTNLERAVLNENFRRVHGLSADSRRVEAFRTAARSALTSRQIRSTNDAVQVMYQVASAASRTLGLSGQAVAAEFVYGAAESLDKYSAFNPTQSLRGASLEDASRSASVVPAHEAAFKTAGIFDTHVVGIGVEIKPDDAGVIVVRTLAGGPARNGGLERGDVITAIDGKTLAGRGLDYAVELISGPIGSSLRVTAAKADGRRGTVTLTRNRVELKSVSEAKILDKASGVAYLKLDSFATTSEEEIDEALWSLWNQGMKSLVFDVRGNPGGLLTGAIGISNRFLPDGTIVSTKGRTREDNTSESAVRGRTWKIPMVVLVDGGSASASEIFAAAIQENGRGLVVGETSYGKGTVQTHFPLQSVAGNLKITTAKFYSPNGREMAGAGVTPDVHVAGTDEIVPLSQDRVVVEAVRLAAGRDAYELARATQQRLSGLTAAR